MKGIWLVLGLSACSPAPYQPGKVLYVSQCTSCHNQDPRRPGAIGPELFPIRCDVLESKLLYGKYPPGYAPRRTTAIMPKYPGLGPNIKDICEYLNEPK